MKVGGRNKNHDILIVAQEVWKVLIRWGEEVRGQQSIRLPSHLGFCCSGDLWTEISSCW